MKRKLTVFLSAVLCLCMFLALGVSATDAPYVAGTGENGNPWKLSTQNISVFTEQPHSITGYETASDVASKKLYLNQYYVVASNDYTFSGSYVEAEAANISKADNGDYKWCVNSIKNLVIAGNEYLTLSSNIPAAEIAGGYLTLDGDASKIKVTGNKESIKNELIIPASVTGVEIEGKITALTGKATLMGDTTVSGGYVVGPESNKYDLTVTGTTTTYVEGWFDTLEVNYGSTVYVYGDTHVNTLTNYGTIVVTKDKTFCNGGNALKPVVDVTFQGTDSVRTLPEGTYEMAAGSWKLGGNVVLNDTECSLCSTDEFSVAAANGYTVTVKKGTVVASEATVIGAGGNLKLNPKNYVALTKEPSDWATNFANYYETKDNINYTALTAATEFVSNAYFEAGTPICYAYGNFENIAFNGHTLTVPANKAISVPNTDVTTKAAEPTQTITPLQDTVIGAMDGTLPTGTAAASYGYKAVDGVWTVDAYTNVEGAGADLTVKLSEANSELTAETNNIGVSGSFDKLTGNTPDLSEMTRATLAGDLAVDSGDYTLRGDKAYNLTVNGGNAAIEGKYKTLTVTGGVVTTTDNGAEVAYETSDDVIAVNVTGGELYFLKGSITVKGNGSKAVYVESTGKCYIGKNNNTEAWNSDETPTIDAYGQNSYCVYANNGGEAWIYAGELNFHDKYSYGVWVNKDGKTHIYPNDQYGENEVADTLLYIHGGQYASSAMWVADGGLFDIRGRGAVLEQPVDGEYALYIHKNAQAVSACPLAGGSFDGKVYYDQGDLRTLIPQNHYLRYDGTAPVFTSTDGTYGILPEGYTTDAEVFGSFVSMHGVEGSVAQFNGTYTNTFGVKGEFYTIADAEYELRNQMKVVGGSYQIPAGMSKTNGADAGALVLDTNCFTEDATAYTPYWGIGKVQADVNVTATGEHTLYLAGRTLSYSGLNKAGTELKTFDKAYCDYLVSTGSGKDILSTLSVESVAQLTIRDAVYGGEGTNREASDFKGGYIGTGKILYTAQTGAGDMARALNNRGKLTVASGYVSLSENSVSGFGIYNDRKDTLVIGVTDEDNDNAIITILGGKIVSGNYSTAAIGNSGNTTINGGSIGTLDSASINGGLCGVKNYEGNVWVKGGIICGGNTTTGVGIYTVGGNTSITGGCIYGCNVDDSLCTGAESVRATGGNVFININKEHTGVAFKGSEYSTQGYTEKAIPTTGDYALQTATFHHINGVHIAGDAVLNIGNIVDEAENHNKNTRNNGTLICEGGTTYIYGGIVMGDTIVYGAELTADDGEFETRFYVEDGDFSALKVKNYNADTTYGYAFCDESDGFENYVQLHGGVFASADTTELRLYNGTASYTPNVSTLLGTWSNEYDIDQDTVNDWVRYNHYATLDATKRSTVGYWDELNVKATDDTAVDGIYVVADGKALYVRNAAVEFANWIVTNEGAYDVNGDNYKLYTNIFLNKDFCTSEVGCAQAVETEALPIVVGKGAHTVYTNNYGLFAEVANTMFTEQALTDLSFVGASGTASVTSNLVRNMTNSRNASVLNVANGKATLTGVELNACGVTVASNSGTVDVDGAQVISTGSTAINAVKGTVVLDNSAIVEAYNTGIYTTEADVTLYTAVVGTTNSGEACIAGVGGNVTLNSGATLEKYNNYTYGVMLKNGSFTMNGGYINTDYNDLNGNIKATMNSGYIAGTIVLNSSANITITGNTTIGTVQQESGTVTVNGYPTISEYAMEKGSVTVTDTPTFVNKFVAYNGTALLYGGNYGMIKTTQGTVADIIKNDVVNGRGVQLKGDDLAVTALSGNGYYTVKHILANVGGGGAAVASSCKLTFNTNGGTEVKTVKEAMGTEIFLDSYTTSKSGAKFAGWYSDEALTTAVTKVMLDEDTTVYAKWTEETASDYSTCAGGDTCVVSHFTDLQADAWYHDGIHYCLDNGLMQGTANTTFAPNTATNRAMIVTILSRIEGVEAVADDVWYAAGKEWAVANGISDGTAMGGEITREQMVTMFYRYAQLKGWDVTVDEEAALNFKDADSVSDWATDAMIWAASVGLIKGDAVGNANPTASATRAETATFFMRLCTLFN